MGWRSFGKRRMEPQLVSRRILTLALPLAVLGASGCFDVNSVDPGPYIIDDFDDGDFLPAGPDFDQWTCNSFNPATNKNFECDHDTGNQSAFSLYLDATIDDSPDGTQKHGGASLAAETREPADLTRFRNIVFSAKLESGSPPIPSNALLYVEFGCKTAPTENGSLPGDLYVVQGVDHKNYWQTFALGLNGFNSPPWIAAHILEGPAGCLRRISNIRFTVDAQLPDGQSGKFRLSIDGISME